MKKRTLHRIKKYCRSHAILITLSTLLFIVAFAWMHSSLKIDTLLTEMETDILDVQDEFAICDNPSNLREKNLCAKKLEKLEDVLKEYDGKLESIGNQKTES